MVDDSPANLALIRGLLAPLYDLALAANGERALALAQGPFPPDLILLDVRMPGLDGYEVCRRLKASDVSKGIPVIFLTASQDVMDEVQGFKQGAVDFIKKPFNLMLVQARVAVHLRLQEEMRRRAEVESQLRAARDEAERANQSKSDFLASMSHELRTPLNAILGYSELLVDELEDLGAQELISDVQKINSAGTHLTVLVNDILDLSKIEAGRVELITVPFNLRGLLLEVRDTVAPLIEKKGNVLDLQCPEVIPTLLGDDTRVRQILYNLLSNAAKFTKQGTINVSVAVGEEPEPDSIMISVRDTGIGMSAAQMERIFEPFRQAEASTSRSFGGTGLGLTICKRLAAMMQGDLTVESQLGQGSTFVVRLPLSSMLAPGEDS